MDEVIPVTPEGSGLRRSNRKKPAASVEMAPVNLNMDGNVDWLTIEDSNDEGDDEGEDVDGGEPGLSGDDTEDGEAPELEINSQVSTRTYTVFGPSTPLDVATSTGSFTLEGIQCFFKVLYNTPPKGLTPVAIAAEDYVTYGIYARSHAPEYDVHVAKVLYTSKKTTVR